MILSRRNFLRLLTAPAVIRVAKLMPIVAAPKVVVATSDVVWNSAPPAFSPFYYALYDHQDGTHIMDYVDCGRQFTIESGETITIDFTAQLVTA